MEDPEHLRTSIATLRDRFDRVTTTDCSGLQCRLFHLPFSRDRRVLPLPPSFAEYYADGGEMREVYFQEKTKFRTAAIFTGFPPALFRVYSTLAGSTSGILRRVPESIRTVLLGQIRNWERCEAALGWTKLIFTLAIEGLLPSVHCTRELWSLDNRRKLKHAGFRLGFYRHDPEVLKSLVPKTDRRRELWDAGRWNVALAEHYACEISDMFSSSVEACDALLGALSEKKCPGNRGSRAPLSPEPSSVRDGPPDGFSRTVYRLEDLWRAVRKILPCGHSASRTKDHFRDYLRRRGHAAICRIVDRRGYWVRRGEAESWFSVRHR